MHLLYSLPQCFAIYFLKGRRHFLKSHSVYFHLFVLLRQIVTESSRFFLQFLCKFRHYPLIPTCFICYYGEFPDFAAVRIISCILSAFFRRFPCFFGKNAVILSFQWFFSPESVHKLFYFHSNPCHSPRIYWFHQRNSKAAGTSRALYRFFHVFHFSSFLLT